MSDTLPPSRKELSRQRILEVASRGVRRQGFAGVGVADVMQQAGLTHGGFYAHFPSREALLSAATHQAGVDSRSVLRGHTARLVEAGVAPFRALVETYLHESGLDDREHGCPVAALLSEMPRQPDEVRREGEEVLAHMHRTVAEALGEEADADAAWAVAASLVGALQMARSVRDRARARAILAATRRDLLARYTD